MRKLNKKISITLATLMVAFLLPFFCDVNVQASTTRVIDVYDGDNISDYQALKDAGIEGVVTKVSQGCTGIQHLYDYRYRMCKATGIPVGFYHWLSSYSQPEQQAEVFYNLIKDYDMDIVPMLDVEAGGEQWGNLSAETYANRFMYRFKELSGLDMIIYSGRAFIEENFSSAFCNRNYFWGAEYGRKIKQVDKVGQWVLWQYTEHGSLPGVIGDVDIDYLYVPEHFYLKNYVPNNNAINILPTPSYNQAVGKVAELQQLLNNNYGTSLSIDNIWGPKTNNALRNSRAITGLPYHNPSLTSWVQLRLGCSVDGIFGNETYKAVCKWQREHGLKVDGIPGYYTIKSLATNNG